MQVSSVLLGLVSTQMPLISDSTRSAKLPFFLKATAVIAIVEFARTYSKLQGMEGGYAQDKLDIRANAPSPLLSKNSVIKGGGAYFQKLTVI